MVNGYKEMVLQKLWENQHPMSFDELSDDVFPFGNEMDRFRTKLYELIRDGYVYKRNGVYGLTEKAIIGIRENNDDV